MVGDDKNVKNSWQNLCKTENMKNKSKSGVKFFLCNRFVTGMCFNINEKKRNKACPF